MKIPKIHTRNIPRILFRLGYLAAIATGMVLTPAIAHADCSDPRTLKFGLPQKLQMMEAPKETANEAAVRNSIVGLWHVIYTSQGQLFLETFDTWHADGTEFETANAAPALGSVCVGVWKQVGRHTVKLFHIGWNFNSDGSSAGYFTLTETNTLSEDGRTYHGTFDFKLYDVSGNLMNNSEVIGSMTAARITVN